MAAEARIDCEKCVDCKRCVEVYTYSVLEWFEDKSIVAHPQNCTGCMEYVSNCPAEEITLREK
ncbi:4Fe-4S ferredoxin [Candidatus Bathyarchaeota archaeon]|nr:4Fe-4S ferredoxin [Candidatus Bathyarchaeota archaeon]